MCRFLHVDTLEERSLFVRCIERPSECMGGHGWRSAEGRHLARRCGMLCSSARGGQRRYGCRGALEQQCKSVVESGPSLNSTVCPPAVQSRTASRWA